VSDVAMARPMPRPPPVTSACAERGSPDMRDLPGVSKPGTGYILYFKLLQEINRGDAIIAFHQTGAC
jgi:hypothetical protein